MGFGPTVRLRLVLQHVLTELYLDDVLMECASLPAPATGRIGLVHRGQVDAFREVVGWSSTGREEADDGDAATLPGMPPPRAG